MILCSARDREPMLNRGKGKERKGECRRGEYSGKSRRRSRQRGLLAATAIPITITPMGRAVATSASREGGFAENAADADTSLPWSISPRRTSRLRRRNSRGGLSGQAGECGEPLSGCPHCVGERFCDCVRCRKLTPRKK